MRVPGVLAKCKDGSTLYRRWQPSHANCRPTSPPEYSNGYGILRADAVDNISTNFCQGVSATRAYMRKLMGQPSRGATFVDTNGV